MKSHGLFPYFSQNRRTVIDLDLETVAIAYSYRKI